jgi:hypothetical protein
MFDPLLFEKSCDFFSPETRQSTTFSFLTQALLWNQGLREGFDLIKERESKIWFD